MGYTYGAGPQHVVTDKSGNILDGIHLEVWTAKNGTQITALEDLNGTLLPGYVTTDDEGRYRFAIDSDTYPTVWIRDPEGDWWQIEADQLADQMVESIQIVNQIEAMVEGTPQNAFYLGLLPEDQGAAAANTTLINQALVDGNVYLPCGTWYFNDSIRIPSGRSLTGGGINCTFLKAVDGTRRNRPVVTNKSNTLTAHTNPDRYIRISGMSIDANGTNRDASQDPTAVNEASCGIQIACAEYVLIENVYATNGSHSFDIAASMYADVDPVTYPPGPSRWIVVRNCIAGSSEDDAFTTHGSQYLWFTDCAAYNEEGVPRNSYSNGIEIDDASLDVNIINFHAYKFHAGVQIKSHADYPPARRVNVIGAVADSCETGFDIWWNNLNTVDPDTLPDYAIAADVTLRNCRAVNLQDLGNATSYRPALRIRSYNHVHVEDFVMQDSPGSHVIMEYGCSHVDIDGLVSENCWTEPYDATLGLVNAYGDVGENIRINNIQVRGNYPIAGPVVRISQPTIKNLTVSRIHGNGDGTYAAVQLARWDDGWHVEDVIGTGHKADIEILDDTGRAGLYTRRVGDWLPSGVHAAADLAATYPAGESWTPIKSDEATAGGWPSAGLIHTIVSDGTAFQYFYAASTTAPQIQYRVGDATGWGAWQAIGLTAA